MPYKVWDRYLLTYLLTYGCEPYSNPHSVTSATNEPPPLQSLVIAGWSPPPPSLIIGTDPKLFPVHQLTDKPYPVMGGGGTADDGGRGGQLMTEVLHTLVQTCSYSLALLYTYKKDKDRRESKGRRCWLGGQLECRTNHLAAIG